MKITFKSYEDLKKIMTDSKSVHTKGTWDRTIYLGGGYDENMDQFLKKIGSNTFKIENYEVLPVEGNVIMRIQTDKIGEDGGFNTNYPFDDFGFTVDFIDTDKTENAPEAWFCRNCGMIVDPKQKYPFEPKRTYKEIGLPNAVCPGCFTKTFTEVKFDK